MQDEVDNDHSNTEAYDEYKQSYYKGCYVAINPKRKYSTGSPKTVILKKRIKIV